MTNYIGENNYYPKKIGRIDFSDNSADNWDNYRLSILESRSKSQDDFEKYLNIYSSGGLLISLTLLGRLMEEKPTLELQFILPIASFTFVVSILSNVFSHYKAISNDDKTIEDIDIQNPQILEEIFKRNIAINWLNKISLTAISIGTILLILFLTINSY